jgi:hypothetical protein
MGVKLTVLNPLAEPIVIERCFAILIQLQFCLERNLHGDVLAILRP